jgi:hypothetical protein
LLKKNEKLD